jgi:hypothetical protein
MGYEKKSFRTNVDDGVSIYELRFIGCFTFWFAL